MGWRRAAIFTAVGYGVAFTCEASAIRNGFPFGHYVYHAQAGAGEIWIAGVPIWDSLSFVFLAYFSHTVAMLIYSPLLVRRRWDVQLADTREIRHSRRVLVTAVAFMVALDVVIDPIALQGSRWFLGDLYHYPHPGVYFGVPITNFLGWAFVGWAILTLFQALDRRLPETPKWRSGWARLPGAALLGPALYLATYLFNLVVTISVGDLMLASADLYIFLLPLVVLPAFLIKRNNRAIAADLKSHLADFPCSPLAREGADEKD